MYLLTKQFHPINFAFSQRREETKISDRDMDFHIAITSYPEDIYHIEIRNSNRWPRDYRITRVSMSEAGADSGSDSGSGQEKAATRIEVDSEAGFRWVEKAGTNKAGTNWEKPLLSANPGRWFGTSGSAWLFCFSHDPDMEYYGLGEKHTPFERSGRGYRFWNVDVWADHPMDQVVNGDYDPDYLSIPYLIIKKGNTYIGLLSDNLFPGMIAISPENQVAQQLKIEIDYPPTISIGAEGGVPSLYCIYGPSLDELTCKFQTLVGKTPLPPLWALGYHQSRWGYRSHEDLEALARSFAEHEFPADGLWLDIDYMENFKVFTFNKAHMPHPERTAAEIKEKGFRIVPILDPGVKREKGYPVYEDGKEKGLFCQNPAGYEFAGMVWPGFTVFPDFTLAETRKCWAGYAKAFFEKGFEGAWIDMNDPSTGPIDCTDMLFKGGKTEHAAFHNSYATLMAKATVQGFHAAHPDKRPFLLSRSGSTGAQRYAAHWTGDNFSTYGHLGRSIGKSINLALSGIPFNGPDIGGFGGDCIESLFIDWVKAGFLFPFFRNHTMRGSRPQEPWAYSENALKITRHFVRLRYHLLPYLYNLFMDQEETGAALLRPLFYDFEDSDEFPIGKIDDQFMVGPALLHAPFVDEKGRTREVTLPAGRWFRADTGQWISGGRKMKVSRKAESTPLFIREGYLIPFAPGKRTDNRVDLKRIGIFCCLSKSYGGECRYRYRADDGLSFDYRKGGRSELEIVAHVEKKRLKVKVSEMGKGFGRIELIPCTVDRFSEVVIERDGAEHILQPFEEGVRMTGNLMKWYRWTLPLP